MWTDFFESRWQGLPPVDCLLAYNHTAGRTVADLDQVDTRGGHRDGLFDGGIAALCYEAAHHVEDADGLLLSTADHDVVVFGVDDSIVFDNVADADILSEEAEHVGGGFGEDDGDGCSGVVFGMYTLPVVEV